MYISTANAYWFIIRNNEKPKYSIKNKLKIESKSIIIWKYMFLNIIKFIIK